MEQRFIVNGINNDKIELVSNYDVWKLNRLLDAKDKMWLTKIKQAREKMEEYVYCDKYDCINEDMTNWICASEAVAILDKLIAESEE